MNLTPPSSPASSPDSGPWRFIQKVPGVQKLIALPLSDQLGCHTCFHPEVQTWHGPRMTAVPWSLTCAWTDLSQAQSAPW